MKRTYCIGMLIAFFVASIFGTASAQQQRDFLNFYYLDVEPGKGGEYRNFFREISSKVHKVRIEAGEIRGAYLMQARVPGGTESISDYILVIVPNGGLGGESMSAGDALKKAGIEMTGSQYWQKFWELTNFVKREIWTDVARIGSLEEGNLIQMDFMDVHNVGDWVDMEREIFKPVHQLRIDEGERVGWGARRLFMPRGRDLQYNGATVNIFADWEQLGKSGGRGFFRRAHPDMDTSDLSEKIGKARTMVRTELFELISKQVASK